MENSDFELSDIELAKLNQFLQKQSRAIYAAEGEPVNDITISFEFAAVIGRSVFVSVSGSKKIDLADIKLDDKN